MDSFQQVDSFQQIDELVKEYLLFRGFSATFRSFESECRNDKDKRFQAEKIIEELFSFITNSDVNGLMDYWRYLDLRYFSRLDARFFGSVKKFEECLLKYYLVYGKSFATQQKRKEKVFEFFDTFGTELNGNSEWTKWFALPSLLCFPLDRLQRYALEDEVQSLHHEIDSIKNGKTDTESTDTEIKQNSTTPNKGLVVISDHYGVKSPEIYADDLSLTPISEYAIDNSQELPGEDINPFTIMNQEIYLEHTSGISLAKFSHKGNLIVSCDVDNIVRTSSMSSIRSTKSNKSFNGSYNLITNVIGGGLTNGGTNGFTTNGSLNKVPMVSFSSDTKHVLCVGGNGFQGVIYQVQLLAPHSSPLTVVDWTTMVGNSVLTGAMDGSVRVTKMFTDGST
ncbi:9299_t:CDS:2 [Racocetra fulgida]|uniref:9299_t:CDS:1 n=1 Tax=Racocetra fulgida TaxID=60492 RepID=A0A9N9ARE6_9GLOM|nr:9299_t:CDS:2 [Racocetra fulgida]